MLFPSLLCSLLDSDSSVDLWLWLICNGVCKFVVTILYFFSAVTLSHSFCRPHILGFSLLCQLVTSSLHCAAISEWFGENSTAIQLMEDKQLSSYMASRIF